MTELPFEDAFFDGAYATESLEHAVEIERAVAEICRVVKPGGRIVVIDKNAEHWGKLETPEWERWFTRRELERMLARHCREVRAAHSGLGRRRAGWTIPGVARRSLAAPWPPQPTAGAACLRFHASFDRAARRWLYRANPVWIERTRPSRPIKKVVGQALRFTAWGILASNSEGLCPARGSRIPMPYCSMNARRRVGSLS